ncbi:MAG: hypothetical protein R3F65_24375 [bacterium]
MAEPADRAILTGAQVLCWSALVLILVVCAHPVMRMPPISDLPLPHGTMIQGAAAATAIHWARRVKRGDPLRFLARMLAFVTTMTCAWLAWINGLAWLLFPRP